MVRAETQRVLKLGVVVFAVAISRYASTFGGLRGGALADRVFEGVVIGDVGEGAHRNSEPRRVDSQCWGRSVSRSTSGATRWVKPRGSARRRPGKLFSRRWR